MSIADQLSSEVQNRINGKRFDHYEETDRSEDWLGNLSAKRLWVNGDTRGSTVEILDAARPLLKVALDLGWTYKRKQYRGIQPPIEEDRTDTGKYIFEVTADLFNGMVISEFNGMVISEKGREASTGDPNHDSARMAFIALLEDVIRPNFRIN